MQDIIDASRNLTDHLACLTAQGIRGTIRYYNRDATPKVIKRREVDAILAAGLTLAIVHQRGGRDPLEYTAETGRLDAEHCRDYGQKMGQPARSGIYFAVDFDISAADLDRHVVPFFTAVAATMAEADSRPAYRVGVYGSGLTCARLLDAGLVDFTWLSQSRGFRGTPQFRASNRWNLLQLMPDKICGVDVDPDIVQPAIADYGQFSAATMFTPLVAAAAAVPMVRMRALARNGARLRAGPGLDFEKKALLAFGRMVFVVRTAGDWSIVDLEGDGRIDGAVHSTLLGPLP